MVGWEERKAQKEITLKVGGGAWVAGAVVVAGMLARCCCRLLCAFGARPAVSG